MIHLSADPGELLPIIGVAVLGLYAVISRLYLYGALRHRMSRTASWVPLAPPALELTYLRNRSEIRSLKLDLLVASSFLAFVLALVLFPLILGGAADAGVGDSR